jgi:hypothetical protein
MPRTTRLIVKAEEQVERTTARRSARLNRSQDLKSNLIVQIDEDKLKRRKLVKEPPTESSPVYAEAGSMSEKTNPRRSCRTASVDLAQWEKALSRREREFERKSNELDDRLSRVEEKERHTSLLISQVAQRDARATLSQLEEHFTCALCYDIMACPISLNPGQCGHTFCALCIVKWFFSRLHSACGGWHESVDCPICRSLLVITPDHSPRPDITFPFTPNRTVDTVVRDLVGKLAVVPSFDAAATKAVKGAKKTEEDTAMAEWRIGGSTRAEWLRRDLTGREEIHDITKKWKNLNSKDFIDLKTKLGV